MGGLILSAALIILQGTCEESYLLFFLVSIDYCQFLDRHCRGPTRHADVEKDGRETYYLPSRLFSPGLTHVVCSLAVLEAGGPG